MSNYCSIVYMIFRIRKYFFQKNNVIQYGHFNYVKTKTKQVYLDEIANYLIALSSFLCKPTCVHIAKITEISGSEKIAPKSCEQFRV